MVQNIYAPMNYGPNIWIIKDKLSDGSFQCDSQLESKQIELMNVMITRWKERYIKYHSQTNEEMPTQPQERIPDRCSNSNTEEDSEVLNNCKKTNKNDQWYADGWNLLVKLHRKIHNNQLPKKKGYASIGHLFNCLINDVDENPVSNMKSVITIRVGLQIKDNQDFVDFLCKYKKKSAYVFEDVQKILRFFFGKCHAQIFVQSKKEQSTSCLKKIICASL